MGPDFAAAAPSALAEQDRPLPVRAELLREAGSCAALATAPYPFRRCRTAIRIRSEGKSPKGGSSTPEDQCLQRLRRNILNSECISLLPHCDSTTPSRQGAGQLNCRRGGMRPEGSRGSRGSAALRASA